MVATSSSPKNATLPVEPDASTDVISLVLVPSFSTDNSVATEVDTVTAWTSLPASTFNSSSAAGEPASLARILPVTVTVFNAAPITFSTGVLWPPATSSVTPSRLTDVEVAVAAAVTSRSACFVPLKPAVVPAPNLVTATASSPIWFSWVAPTNLLASPKAPGAASLKMLIISTLLTEALVGNAWLVVASVNMLNVSTPAPPSMLSKAVNESSPLVSNLALMVSPSAVPTTVSWPPSRSKVLSSTVSGAAVTVTVMVWTTLLPSSSLTVTVKVSVPTKPLLGV